MSQNSTKKSKTSLKQLQKHIKATVSIWTKTAENLEEQAEKETDENMKHALYLPAAVFRGCATDLQGVADGKVILDKADKAFQEMPALVDQSN